MPPVLHRRRDIRKAVKLARLLAALDSAAVNTRPAARRAGRVSLRRA